MIKNIYFFKKDIYFWNSLIGKRVNHILYGNGKILSVDFFDPFTVYVQIIFDKKILSDGYGYTNKLDFNNISFINNKITLLDDFEKRDNKLSFSNKDSFNNRALEIKYFCEKRNITNLIHFTRINNLLSILKYGLVGRNDLNKLSQRYQPEINDKDRYDGYPEAICLSITFPNYKMFYSYRRNIRGVKWVVLLIDVAVLWKLDCAFCLDNASSRYVKNIPIAERKKVKALEDMFKDFNDIKRKELKIPDSFPTNPQAEVLVFSHISPKYISSVNFEDKKTLKKWIELYWSGHYNVKYIYSNNYFKPRQDYNFWTFTQ